MNASYRLAPTWGDRRQAINVPFDLDGLGVIQALFLTEPHELLISKGPHVAVPAAGNPPALPPLSLSMWERGPSQRPQDVLHFFLGLRWPIQDCMLICSTSLARMTASPCSRRMRHDLLGMVLLSECTTQEGASGGSGIQVVH